MTGLAALVEDNIVKLVCGIVGAIGDDLTGGHLRSAHRPAYIALLSGSDGRKRTGRAKSIYDGMKLGADPAAA